MRTCPFCAEEVQEAAVLCRHCRSPLSSTPPAAPSKARPSRADDGVSATPCVLALIACGVGLIGAILDRWPLIPASGPRVVNFAVVLIVGVAGVLALTLKGPETRLTLVAVTGATATLAAAGLILALVRFRSLWEPQDFVRPHLAGPLAGIILLFVAFGLAFRETRLRAAR